MEIAEDLIKDFHNSFRFNIKEEEKKKKFIFDKEKNLSDIILIFKRLNISYWLYGRTLLFANKINKYSRDKADFIGIWKKEISKDSKKIIEEFKKLKFFIVKENDNYSILHRNNLFIKIIYFNKINTNLCIASGDKFNSEYFFSLRNEKVENSTYKIPDKTEEILRRLFSPSFFQLTSKTIFEKDFNLLNRIVNLVKLFFLSIIFNNLSKYELQFRFEELKTKKIIDSFKKLNKFVISKVKKKPKKISLEEFKELEIDFDEFNWIFRKRHLDIITNKGKCTKVGQIIDFLKPNKLNELKSEIVETPADNVFDEPIYWSKNFWNKGNNFFIYSIIFGFKKNVIPYDKVNFYINNKKSPNIYSYTYYDSLPNMDDKEISKLLKSKPLEIYDNGFSSGRHRACAMIGRLIREESYIPIYAYKT